MTGNSEVNCRYQALALIDLRMTCKGDFAGSFSLTDDSPQEQNTTLSRLPGPLVSHPPSAESG
jgi:hypothetical protein